MANNPVNVRRVRAVASFLLWVASPLVPIVGGFYEPGISLLVVPLSFVFLALWLHPPWDVLVVVFLWNTLCLFLVGNYANLNGGSQATVVFYMLLNIAFFALFGLTWIGGSVWCRLRGYRRKGDE